MEKIKEMIVVEGQNDTNRLRQFFDVDTIETGGFNLSKDLMERIREAHTRRGVIVFTDPDFTGERIRTRINKEIPGVKNAFIDRDKALGIGKIGVEHANYEDLKASLEHCVTFNEPKESLSWNEFLDLKIMGDKKRREKVSQAFHLGHCSTKVCYKRLCQLGITADEIREALHE